MKNIDRKLSKGKFVERIKIDEDVLKLLDSAEDNFQSAKEKLDKEYKMVENFFEFIKPQISQHFLKH